ncbi:MAG: YaaC family protein, partial [Dehalococcoidia bacterium]
MRRTTRRWGLSSRVFATDPWPVIARAVRTEATVRVRPAALAFLQQAKDYYVAATQAGLAEVKPVLLYYCFLNLGKVLSLA